MVLFAQIQFVEGVIIALFCPDQQVAEPRVELGAAILVGFHLCQRVIFGVIVQFEAHGGVFGGQVVFVIYRDICRGRVGVVGEQVDAGVVRCALVDLFGTFVAAEDIGVYHHGACGNIGEPAHVEGGGGFAGAEEVPFAIDPDLDPGVVVVAVRPARGVALAGGDANGAQGSDGERALLAATPVRSLQCGQRCGGARIGGLIINILVAPVVHLQRRIVHAHVFNAVFELVEDV